MTGTHPGLVLHAIAQELTAKNPSRSANISPQDDRYKGDCKERNVQASAISSCFISRGYKRFLEGKIPPFGMRCRIEQSGQSDQHQAGMSRVPSMGDGKLPLRHRLAPSASKQS
jgi:hypothetical protein